MPGLEQESLNSVNRISQSHWQSQADQAEASEREFAEVGERRGQGECGGWEERAGPKPNPRQQTQPTVTADKIVGREQGLDSASFEKFALISSPPDPPTML